MEEFKVIEFQQARDFSKKLNTTFEFIRQNFKSLGKSILYIAGPPVFVCSVIAGSFISEFLSLTQSAQNAGDPEGVANYFISISFWTQLVLLFVFFVIGFVVSIATINSYLILYTEKKTNMIEVQDVWNRVRNTFWTYLGTSLLFYISFIVVVIVLMIPTFILGAISNFLIFFGVLILFIGIIYLAISSSLIYFVQSFERKNFFESLVRSYKLVNNGKWWSTFGLILILDLIMGTASSIFVAPYYFISIVKSLHTISTGTIQELSSAESIIASISITLYVIARMLFYVLPNIGIAFQYFNLVELKEARGLMSQIETIGQPSVDPNRPEENF
jgi:hypothetical protein